jgi:DNA repair protein RecN (Recombination protein N)
MAQTIEFRVTTNPGQPLQAISKVASGGELSRIALAIQVITARKMETPALIFDEWMWDQWSNGGGRW